MQPVLQMSTALRVNSGSHWTSMIELIEWNALTCHIVFLPCEHDFWGPVVACWDVTGHLWILNPRQTKIANLDTKWGFIHPPSEIRTFRSQFSFTKMLLGFYLLVSWYWFIKNCLTKSRCTTPAEWTYFSPRYDAISASWDSNASGHITSIWYKKYWMNCFSNGREVNSRWRSVPKSSVTKYLENRVTE